MSPRLFVIVALAACGGSSRGPTTPASPTLTDQIADARWYRSATPCAQGPFELTVPIEGGRWDEEVTLQLQTTHAVELKAVAYGPDGAELLNADGVYTQAGPITGKAANAKCVADERERKVLLGQGGGGSSSGTPVPTGTLVPPPDAPTITPTLVPDPSVPTYVTGETQFGAVLRLPLPTGTLPPGAIIRIKFWSINPNDLVGVAFGVVRRARRPNTPVAEYDAHLGRLAIEHDAEVERLRVQADLERQKQLAADLEWNRQATLRAERDAEERRKREASLTPEQRRARDERLRKQAEDDRRRSLQIEEMNRRREAELARARLEAQASYEAKVRAEQERRLQREAFCAAHHEDRGCWGAGGYAMHLKIQQSGDLRANYCAANPKEARCWSDIDRATREAAWSARIELARRPPPPPPEPTGPPPAPLAETQPPRLSVHADWRAGYWVWLDGNWVWLAGQWRVPDEDIVNLATTEAPAPPPPPQVEVIAIAPARTTVWVAGFWQWGGSQWVWIAGSWQVRPSTTVEWRAPEWRPRGRAHILVPGAWIKIGGRR